MSKVSVAYLVMDNFTPEQARSKQETILIDYQEIKFHMIFDIKIDFTRKGRFVVGSHTTKAPTSFTYSSVVSIYNE